MAIWISKLLEPVILVLSSPMIVTPTSLQQTTRRFLADSPLDFNYRCFGNNSQALGCEHA